jgi:hypothetical protein
MRCGCRATADSNFIGSKKEKQEKEKEVHGGRTTSIGGPNLQFKYIVAQEKTLS